ncbi:MAG TPA: hypothetical protein VI915_03490 [Thermoplasmata archaeon]|nr:MAG: hypothetical protein A3K65_01520 [Euryarchaeota archaeon RBG_16_68_12]HLE46039.1 hypothetical protein [Thermoplasmata archaeon]
MHKCAIRDANSRGIAIRPNLIAMGSFVAATGGGSLFSAAVTLANIAESSYAVCGYHNLITEFCGDLASQHFWYYMIASAAAALLGGGVALASFGAATSRRFRKPIAAHVLGLAGGLLIGGGFAMTAYITGRTHPFWGGLPPPDLQPTILGAAGGALAAVGAVLSGPLRRSSRGATPLNRGPGRAA